MSANDVWGIAAADIARPGISGQSVFGLESWLGKVWATRILENERQQHARDLERLKTELEHMSRRFQGEIDKTVYVHRVHFEAEFRALRKVWRRLSHLRTLMSGLRPIISIG